MAVGHDLRDRNIRIAPTYPSMNDLVQAAEILCVCIQIVSIRTILSKLSRIKAE
jgi:hypothetical protein